ncbi:MAG TPA: pyridoxamine 5'-phosphate oxidase family protein, partial [Terriglobales bacterium]|nr:pyridoxamine 5'-phosphate oxidase family protein [Terriglobales bacterium]
MASIDDPLVQELLAGRYVATLATQNQDGSPHLVSVWFFYAQGKCYIATASRSKKARNLKERPAAALMVDSRDEAASRGVTISGAARLLSGEESKRLNSKIHAKYLSDAAIHDARVGPVFAQWD